MATRLCDCSAACCRGGGGPRAKKQKVDDEVDDHFQEEEQQQPDELEVGVGVNLAYLVPSNVPDLPRGLLADLQRCQHADSGTLHDDNLDADEPDKVYTGAAEDVSEPATSEHVEHPDNQDAIQIKGDLFLVFFVLCTFVCHCH